jgi:DnaJ-class molecular chaperone
MSANRKTYDPFDDEEEYDPLEDPDWCPECQGEGRVPTMEYESYLGALYKTCPLCHGVSGDGPLA